MFTLLALTALAHAVPESCNGIDDNGDGRIDEGPVWAALDADSDGFGRADSAALVADCADLLPGEVSDASDPDDSDPEVHPGAVERCNARDDDGDGSIDEGACDCDAYLVGGDLYKVCTDSPATWFQADALCADAGYHLATVHSTAFQGELEDVLLPYGVDVWIGLHDLDVEGQFEWVSGGPVSDTNWRANEPNNAGYGEDCVEVEPVTGLWDDEDCTVPQAFVCERDCELLTFFDDADGDGLGDPGMPIEACVQPPGTVRNAADCHDGDPSLPGLFYVDADMDGFGAGAPVVACAGDLSDDDTDCDDTRGDVNPAAAELDGDATDSDCDGSLDRPADPPEEEAPETTYTPTLPPRTAGALQEFTRARSIEPKDSGTETGPTRSEEDPRPSDDSPVQAQQPRDPDYGFGVGCSAVPGPVGAWPPLLALLGLLARRTRS